MEFVTNTSTFRTVVNLKNGEVQEWPLVDASSTEVTLIDKHSVINSKHK